MERLRGRQRSRPPPPIEVGHRNAFEAEITEGLTEGMEVILHPANDLKDDARVIPRN